MNWNWELDTMRDWIKKQPASPRIKRARLHLFDLYRYQEDYEKIHQLIQDLIKS